MPCMTPGSQPFSIFKALFLAGLSLAVCGSDSGLVPAAQIPEASDRQGFQIQTLALKNARVQTAATSTPEKAVVLIREGRVAAVGPQVAIPPDARVLDLEGLLVLPAFIDAGSSSLVNADVKLPVVERRPVDLSRSALAISPPDDHHSLTPQFQAADALKFSSTDLNPFRQAGFAAVHVVPEGRVISGQSALVQLSGLPPRDALLRDAPAMTFRIQERYSSEYPSTMMGIFAHLRQHFLDAERAALQQQLFEARTPGIVRPPQDAVWQALESLRRGGQRALFEVETRDDIARALGLCSEFGLRPLLWGPRELPESLSDLQAQQAGMVLSLDFGPEPKADQTSNKADKPDGDADKTAAFPKLPVDPGVLAWRHAEWIKRLQLANTLEKAGIPWCWSTRGLKSPDDAWKAIRQLIAADVPPETVLAGFTNHAAALLELPDLGQIAVGQRANLLAINGPLDHDQTKVRHLFVDGVPFEFHKDAKPVTVKADSASAGKSAAAEKPVDLSGFWSVSIDAGESKLEAQWELESPPSGLAGRMASTQGNGRVTRGAISKTHVEIDVSIGAGDTAVVLKFSGELKGEEITGTLKSPFGPATPFTAQKLQPFAEATLLTFEGIEGAEDDREAGPVSALTALTGSPVTGSLRAAAKQPLELPEDRRARRMPTGGNVLIRGGTVITGTGSTLPETDILVRDGLIAEIGPNLTAEPGLRVIDATGRYVMPGMIDTHSHIMISNGLGGVNEATNSIVCEVRVNDVINTADSAEYRALAGGVTTIRLLHGSANVIGGQDAIVQLRHGETAAAHLYPEPPVGVKFALGENVKYRRGRFPNTRLGVEATLQRAFVEALEYRRVWQEYEQARKNDAAGATDRLPPRRDLRLEALTAILNQEMFIHSHCYRSDEILMLLRVADYHGIRVRSLQHVLEGYKVAPEIVAHGASCSTFADWWAYKVEAIDAVPQNAALLHAAGANAVIKSDNDELMRHLNQEASKSVRYANLSPDVALSFVTINPAKELGIDDRVGSIEVGKQADLALFNAHPLNTFARCEMTLIAGEPYFVRDQQPTAMSAAGLKASARPRDIPLPEPKARRPWIDWSAVKGDRFALVGGTVHPVDQPDIEHATVLCADGRITAVGAQLEIPEDHAVINIEGLHVYPGLIDAGTTLGLTEIGKVVETHDYAETGVFQPDLQAGVGINPDSELLPVARAGGITTAFVRPTGGVIAGQGSLIQLAGWTAPQMVRVLDAGLQIHWPGAYSNRNQLEQLQDWFRAARVYDAARSAANQPDGLAQLVDPRYEALRPYLHGERRIFVEADSAQHISEVLKWAAEEKLQVVLSGASDAWKLAEKIHAAGVPVIIGPTMRGPVEDYDPYDATYANPGLLHEAGVKFCIRSDNAANSRNAPFEAAMAVAYGLPEDVALRSVTLSAAEILGCEAETGSVTAGKRADLVILDGSPLQVTSQVKGVIVGGQRFQPESRQTRLTEKYRQRLLAP